MWLAFTSELHHEYFKKQSQDSQDESICFEWLHSVSQHLGISSRTRKMQGNTFCDCFNFHLCFIVSISRWTIYILDIKIPYVICVTRGRRNREMCQRSGVVPSYNKICWWNIHIQTMVSRWYFPCLMSMCWRLRSSKAPLSLGSPKGTETCVRALQSMHIPDQGHYGGPCDCKYTAPGRKRAEPMLLWHISLSCRNMLVFQLGCVLIVFHTLCSKCSVFTADSHADWHQLLLPEGHSDWWQLVEQ